MRTPTTDSGASGPAPKYPTGALKTPDYTGGGNSRNIDFAVGAAITATGVAAGGYTAAKLGGAIRGKMKARAEAKSPIGRRVTSLLATPSGGAGEARPAVGAASKSAAPKQGVATSATMPSPAQGGEKVPVFTTPSPGKMSKPSTASAKPATSPTETLNSPTQATSAGIGMPKPPDSPPGLPKIDEAMNLAKKIQGEMRVEEGAKVATHEQRVQEVVAKATGGGAIRGDRAPELEPGGRVKRRVITPKPAVSQGATPQPTGGMPTPGTGVDTMAGRAAADLVSDEHPSLKGLTGMARIFQKRRVAGVDVSTGAAKVSGGAPMPQATAPEKKTGKKAGLPAGVKTPTPNDMGLTPGQPPDAAEAKTVSAPPKAAEGETVIKGPGGQIAIRRRHTRTRPAVAAETARMAARDVDATGVEKPISPGGPPKPPPRVNPAAHAGETKAYLENVQARRELEPEAAKSRLSDVLPDSVKKGLEAIRTKVATAAPAAGAEAVAFKKKTPKLPEGQTEFQTPQQVAKAEGKKARLADKVMRAQSAQVGSTAQVDTGAAERAARKAAIEKHMATKGFTKVETPTIEHEITGKPPEVVRAGPTSAIAKEMHRADIEKASHDRVIEEAYGRAPKAPRAKKTGGKPGRFRFPKPAGKAGLVGGALLGASAAVEARAAEPGQRLAAAGGVLREGAKTIGRDIAITAGLAAVPGVGPAAAAGYAGYRTVEGIVDVAKLVGEASKGAAAVGSAFYEAYKQRKASESKYGDIATATKTRKGLLPEVGMPKGRIGGGRR